MTWSLLTISVIGFIAGFLFSMPIAGPISILVTSNALKGRLRYCNLMALGASLADFIYVFIAVYGITKLLTHYKGIIPYILGAGAFFVFFVGLKIIRTKFDIEHIDDDKLLSGKDGQKEKGAFYTGFMINFLNPTLFFGWLISSFIILSFASSLGFNTGGLNTMVYEDFNQIEKMEGNIMEKPKIPLYLQFDTLNILKNENLSQKPSKLPSNSHLYTSFFYAASLAAGSIIWFQLLTLILIKFRKKININVLNWIVRSLGIILCIFAVFFVYTSVKMLI